MTLQEKAALLGGKGEWETRDIPRLGIPSMVCSDGPSGLRRQAGTGDHLGLNPSLPATCFPCPSLMACSWDQELEEAIGAALGEEAADQGVDILLGPGLNIKRNPLCGRNFEYFSEDPYLSGKMAAAFIRGVQSTGAAACAKHFAVHSGPEAIRHEFDAKASKHDMYDTYLYAFKRCVKDAKVEAVMGAYNRVNGEPACGSRTLLKDILRDEFGFEGHVVSDCWAILDFHEHHHVTDTVEESAAMAVNNGCDLNCGSAFLHLKDAYDKGLVSDEAITAAVERLMEVRIRLGMMKDYPSPYEDISYEVVECKEHVELSVEAARRSLVLLKNKDNFLPLDRKNVKLLRSSDQMPTPGMHL